jgi:hypothetical protein
MQSVTSATAVATIALANDITLLASLELSKSKWVVTINSPGSEKFSKHVVEGGDGACLLDLLSRSRAKAEQRHDVRVKGPCHRNWIWPREGLKREFYLRPRWRLATSGTLRLLGCEACGGM